MAVSCLAAGGAPLDSILILPPKPPLHSLCAGDATLVSIWSCTQERVEKNTANDILHVCILYSLKEDRAEACVHERVWNIVSRPHGTWLPSVHWLSSARKSLEMAQTPPAKQNPWKFFKSSLSETGKICKLDFLCFFLLPSSVSVGAQNEKWKQKLFLWYNCIERISVISNQFTKKSSTINKFRSCPMAWLYNFLSDYLEAMLFEFAG